MAVVVSIARGHDASYPWRTIGTVDGATFTGQRGAGYYLSAVEKGGEPAGMWIGNGTADLGFRDGDTVRREDFEPLYGQFLDPRDPTGQTYLGSPPRINAELNALYQAKVRAEPEATSERKAQLWVEARAEYQGPVGVQYWDTTFSVDKTISLAHAAATAAAIRAFEAGDLELSREWEQRATGIWAEIEKSVRLYIAHMQRETAFVRTGHHGRRIDGLDVGRFEDAHEIPVAIFPQHTSRNGDPQLHVHILWLNKVKTVRDGQWRAIDSRGLHRNKGAGSALAAFALETGLSHRDGFEWAYRPASKGRVIRGAPERAIREFSSRRAQITKYTQALVEEYERERGHAPDQRATSSMRQFANSRTRRSKEHGPLDFAVLLREWEETSRNAELGTLRDLAQVIWRAVPRTQPDATQMAAQLASRGQMTYAQEHAAMAAGLAQAQEAHSTWSRADLVHCIGQHLPDHAIADNQEHAGQLLSELTDRALAGETGEEVMRLDAPEWPRVPDSLRRANGESIYRSHGAELYATRTQLSLEDRLLAEAQSETAPHLLREDAARLLGADLADLEAQLHAHAAAMDGTTGGGLRLDQAAAAYLALTSPRRVELIVGPAGTGKTYTAVAMANAWRAAGRGRVYGIATTSAGRNVMLKAGIPTAENTAQFLGHLPGRREARGATDIGPDALLILDEASMTSMPDLAGTIRHAANMGSKVIITGDHAQLTAVESGGGMEMLARKLGYAQLTEAVRFQNDWEGNASLAIRAGDVAALGSYDEQGRLHGGTYEEMAEQACRAWLAEHLVGVDVILTAYEVRECADLSRRIQGYLMDWGQLRLGATVQLRDDARAYVGDLIVARENDNQLEAGEHGRTLANGDLLRVENVGDDGMTVCRVTGHDQQTGQRTWSAPFTLTSAYAAANCDLGYAVTWHTVEGRTVSVGIALANDKRTRSGLYPAMTRGEQRNDIYAYPSAHEPPESDIGRGPAPDPEVARQRRLESDRQASGPVVAADERDPIAILAPVIRRDDSELSATETREYAFSNADHLGALHAIWLDHCRAESAARYTRAIRESLDRADADEILRDADSLWRTVRAAELAGLDGAEVIRDAVEGRSFSGARSYSAVLDARIRKKIGHLPPLVRESWRARLPRFADADVARYMAEVAAAMDNRQRRIGEHAAVEGALWATRVLGAVPEDLPDRAEWQRRAGQLGAYREIVGYDHPGEAIGPEPGATSPEARATWHAAFAAMAHVEGIDVRHLSEGQLLARRRAYEAETSWAPKYVAAELRAARRQEHFSRIETTRHTFEAAAAGRQGRPDTAALHEKAAQSWLALEERATQVRQVLARAHDTRCEWEVMTEPTRRLARASDIELKRRGLLSRDDHLRSAEPEGFVYPDRDEPGEVMVQPRLDGGVELPREPIVLSAAEREERSLEVLGLTLDYDQPELPLQIREISDYNRKRQAEIDERRSLRIPSEDPDELDLGEAWNVLAERRRDAVIQPPKPQIPAARKVLEHAADREVGR